MITVAVEQGLEPVKAYLEQQGCQCIEVDNEQAPSKGATCMVVTGGDRNLMGMQDITTQIPIINAEGLTPEEVYERVKTYVH
ncbi:MAG: YkuS family protein [Alicyclobacillus sp.]|nr:YkuS family protein [Alicyclobacillus sp.]